MLEKNRKLLVCAGVLVVLSFCFAPPVQAALVGAWAMDDNAASSTVVNSVNAANNGTAGIILNGGSLNTNTLSVAGKIGSAINFAPNVSVPVTAGGDLKDILSNYSVSMWIKDYDGGASRQLFTFGGFNYPTAGRDNRLDFEIHEGELGVYTSHGPRSANALLTWTAGQWYNVTLTQSSGVIRVYRDGVECTLGGVTTGYPDPKDYVQKHIEIGALGGWGGSIAAKVDDVSLWDVALDGAYVAAITNLADSALNYGTVQANELFVGFDGQTTVSTDGETWYYAASGIGGVDGAVNDLGDGNYSLNLGGGAGMTTVVPEPGVLALLVCGLFGLLAYAWKKRL
ncbi:MAG: LamG domain-containing protein [Pirellulaceae bacterium]|nr:LamG domain-containing protein [Pirellulaceae bacterium]